jgi:Family of unknown function (DUF6188)
MTTWKLEPSADGGLRLPIETLPVSRLTVDYGLTLEFHGAEQYTAIRIEGAFKLMSQRESILLNTEDLSRLGPALALFGQVVRSAQADVNGTLTIVFADGHILSVEPDPKYEAWDYVGPKGSRVVCTPGGKVAIWQPAM